MGVDLTLLPLMSPDFWCSHDVIEVERRRELWPEIEKLEQHHAPGPLRCFLARDKDGETCYGNVKKTPYGDRLMWTTPRRLLTLKDHEAVQDNWRNRAVWSYLASMPPEWPVVLYWH
jgi:hypothetical protein